MNPFEPLSADEIEKAVTLFRKIHSDEHACFSSSGLVEPQQQTSNSATKS